MPTCSATAPPASLRPRQQLTNKTGTAGTFFLGHDQIGSTRTLLSTTGTVAGGYDYTPYVGREWGLG